RFSRDWSSDVCSSDLRLRFRVLSPGSVTSAGLSNPGDAAVRVTPAGLTEAGSRRVNPGSMRQGGPNKSMLPAQTLQSSGISQAQIGRASCRERVESAE